MLSGCQSDDKNTKNTEDTDDEIVLNFRESNRLLATCFRVCFVDFTSQFHTKDQEPTIPSVEKYFDCTLNCGIEDAKFRKEKDNLMIEKDLPKQPQPTPQTEPQPAQPE